MGEEKHERLVNFHLDDETKKELDILSKREGRSLKAIFNELAKEYVRVHKEGNPQHLLTSFQENEDFTGFPSMAIEYRKKKAWIKKYCNEDGRMNDMGKELWGHILQWKAEMQKL